MKLITILIAAIICLSNTSNAQDVLSDLFMLKNGKTVLDRSTHKLLKDFNITNSLNDGTSRYIHKGFNIYKDPVSYKYRLGYGLIINSTAQSTFFLSIMRNSNNTFLIELRVNYVYPSNAISKIDDVDYYEFKWGNNSFLIHIEDHNNPYSKLLTKKEFDILKDFSQSKEGLVLMHGTNNMEVKIPLSKNDMKRISETIELFKGLTE